MYTVTIKNMASKWIRTGVHFDRCATTGVILLTWKFIYRTMTVMQSPVTVPGHPLGEDVYCISTYSLIKGCNNQVCSNLLISQVCFVHDNIYIPPQCSCLLNTTLYIYCTFIKTLYHLTCMLILHCTNCKLAFILEKLLQARDSLVVAIIFR